MNKAAYVITGLILGIIVTGASIVYMMPSMMIQERLSPYNVAETVEKIKQNALAEGWVISGVSDLSASVKKHGNHTIRPTFLINMCQADHAYKILSSEPARKISVFMPCTISVYEKNDGKAYISSMNAGLLGKMFGGIVSEVMGNTVAEQQKKFLAFADNSN